MDSESDLDFLDDLEVEEVERVERLDRARKEKHYKFRKNPLETLDDSDFKKKYRFSKETFYYILNLIQDDIAGDVRGGSIPAHLQLLTALRTWARGEIQDDCSDLHGMSQPTVSIVCKRVGIALASRSADFITMPLGTEQQSLTIQNFYEVCGFRSVIGAIDCTHIRIPKVTGSEGQYYINRKGYSSINVQVACNAKLKIMDIVAHWRGSTHDSRIFNESSLKQRFMQGEFRGRLLGDSGYACTPYLFTPVLNPRTRKEELYNTAHIRTRNIVERCFGLWKQRFRCLLNGFTTSLENTKIYIVALAVLHNIAVQRNDLLEEIPFNSQVAQFEIEDIYDDGQLRGNAVRAAFIQQNF